MKNPPPLLLPPPLSSLRIRAHPPDIPPIAEVEVHSTRSIIISKNYGAALARNYDLLLLCFLEILRFKLEFGNIAVAIKMRAFTFGLIFFL
ncbi:hypothetical protein Y032_0087g2009 [Ancylostoma ceylanicum]|uniref:Uncharacterized protein n=1 Tax=Ancylostoma ceylanicum TaxID=53326 RepID=A0A016TP07_9BILA|nr:hypothetical protein Y032_0087g2009 [Ancylostoma ceylanicum]